MAVGNKESMDGLRLALRRFSQTLSSSPRRRTEQDAQAFLFGQADDGLNDGRLPRPGTAGDDGHPRLKGLFDGFPLFVRQFKMTGILPAVEKQLDMRFHRKRLHGSHLTDPAGNGFFLFIGFRRIDVDRPLKIRRP